MTPAPKQKSPAPPAWEAADGETAPINLEACYANGDACFFPYAYLGYCRFDLGGVIELHFSSRVLRLEGRNLHELYAALVKHAVSVVRQADAGEQGDEKCASIEKIEVTDADE